MLERISYRLKQFLFALSARMSEENKTFARQYLDIKEAALFNSLPEFERKHAVVVAQKMMAEARGRKDIDQRKLIRLGLLHDIGKAAVRLTILDKSILVALNRGAKPLYDLLAKQGEPENSPQFFRKFYVHKHHGLIGSRMLERIGENRDIIEEVRSHDFPKTTKDEYMKILERADSTI